MTSDLVTTGVKVGGNAWERRFQARHFCNPAFPGLNERFFRQNARSQAGYFPMN